ncbi:TPA: hypothetical protein ACUA5P_003769 [Escherichia coli]|nr:MULTISPECIES: hypothetical protein [Escherichia]MCF6501345.1 hypothetical protein [Escherichia coli]MCZ6947105.1 hypothetical protein [Escherichia coli]
MVLNVVLAGEFGCVRRS